MSFFLFLIKQKFSPIHSHSPLKQKFSIYCQFKNYEDGFCWVFIGVYGPLERSSREAFWEELGAVRGLW